jgi:DNA-directed RNA polymerase subunit A'
VAIAMQFGFDVLERFITNSSKLAFAYATTFGVTMGVKDYMISDEIRKEKAKLLSETQSKVDVLVSEYKTKKLEPLLGLTARQSLEQLLVVELDLARSKASQILIKNVDKHNFAMIMANSGARASILNFEQMSLFLGQQATWEGRRIKRGYYSNRAIPHIARGDVGPAARGFISNCFLDGLSPIEMLMHAVGARGSVIQKGLLTQRSGYLQRRLANAMQDYYISSDSTVRDTSNNLVQTIYGGDGIDPTKVNFVKEEERLLKEKG